MTGGELLLEPIPNPCADRATVHFSAHLGTAVHLSVHDVLGREVACLLDATVDGSVSSVSFDAGMLPAGNYLLRLTTGGTTLTRTMIVAR